MTGRRFLVHGGVQGVGYRRFVQRAGTRLGLVGRVRNLPDGRVEVEAWGTAEQLTAFAGHLQAGPPASYVTKVEEIEISDEPEGLSAFIVEH